MEMKIPMVAISAAIVVIVLAAVLMPVLGDATTTEDKFTNKGRFYMDTSVSDDVTITMNYDIENSVRSWYIDGVLLSYEENDDVIRPTVVGTDNFVFRTDGRSRGLNSATGGTDYTVTVTSSSVVTGNKTGNAPLMVASTSETDNIMRYSSTSDAYLLGSSEMIACGWTSLKISDENTTDGVISFTGSIDDGVEITIYNGTYTFTASNVQINADEVNGYEDLYKFTSVTFDATYNDGETDWVTPCTYSVIVIPSEVTAERSVHLNGNEIAILAAIPALVIVALLIGVLAIFFRSKMD